MKAQRREARNLAACQHRERVFVGAVRHDDAEARDLLAEEFDDGVFEPALAEAGARRLAPRLLRARARIVGVLEERNARPLPEAPAEQERRVDGRGEHGRGDRLREVVLGGELPRVDLQVYLKARAARNQQDVVVLDVQLVAPLDVSRERAPRATRRWSVSARDSAASK
jgi:site-specific DNA-cytosine methylase